MASMTNYLENKLIDKLLRGQSYDFPSVLEFALVTANGTDADAGTEVIGGGYARVPIACSLDNFSGTQAAGSTAVSSGDSGTSYNNIAITFPVPGADFGTVVGIEIYDAHTAGNRLFFTSITPKTIHAGDAAPSFPIGSVGLQIDN